MHYAQCLAGMAFSNALLRITHPWRIKPARRSRQGISLTAAPMRYIGRMSFGTTRGAAGSRYAQIARFTGLPAAGEEGLVKTLCDKINETLELPTTLKNFGIKEDEFTKKLPSIAELAVGDACTGSNPRPITPKEMATLMSCTYYGKEVDF